MTIAMMASKCCNLHSDYCNQEAFVGKNSRFYTDHIAQHGYIGIAMAQSPEYVAPYGASEAVYGTNPIAVSIPSGSEKDPITFDMATSSMAWYALERLSPEVLVSHANDQMCSLRNLAPWSIR